MMFRVLELLALLAPVLAGALLLRYRRRSRAAFTWGMVGCLLAALASGVSMVAVRTSVMSSYRTGGDAMDVLAQLGWWAWLRFALLVLAAVLLIVAALVDRGGDPRPVGWIAGGLLAGLLGVAVRGVEVPVPDHEGLGVVLVMMKETLEAALLGLSVLLLAVAAVAHRPPAHADDAGRAEPTELARRAGVAAWRLYTDTRRTR
ncbi:hypothetical protein [Ornithinimicrobium avium]|nr:hypothetical protein [Ornithinimicrobium avium]